MIKIKISFILSFLALFVDSCAPHRMETLAVIDVNSSEEMSISRMFQQIDLIPLETCDSSLIGLDVKRLECNADRIYLLNQMSTRSNLLCFDTTGTFLFRMDRMGNGPHEYVYLGDFFIDPRKKRIVLVAESGHFLYLDLDGNFIATQRVEQGYYARQTVVPYKESFYWAFNDAHEYPLGIDLLQLDTATMEIQRVFSSSTTLPNSLPAPLATNGAQTLYYHINDTIYDIGKNKIVPLYRVSMGEKQEACKRKLPELIAKDPIGYVAQVGQWFQDGDFKMVTHIGVTPSQLFISAVKQNPLQSRALQAEAFFVIYDKITGKTYNSENLKWDILGLESIADVELVGYSDSTLYGWFRRPFSVADKEKIKKSRYLSQKVKEKLLFHTEEDNPVLFMLR